MSIRTSARSNKGQNKYLKSLLEEEVEPDTYQHNETPGEEEEEGEDSVRCPVCGTNDENYDAEHDLNGDMVQCDNCNTWQHIKCMTGGQDSIDRMLNKDGKYFCDQCDPSKYTHLIRKVPDLDIYEDGDKDFNADDDEEEDDNNTSIIGKGLRDGKHRSRNGGGSIKRGHIGSVSSAESNHSSMKRRKSSHESNLNSGSPSQIDKDTKLRQNAKKMFFDLFAKFIIPDTIENHLYELPNDPVENVQDLANHMAENLEKELYDAWFDMENNMLSKFYPEKVRSLYSNLKDKKNLMLKNHVINGKISLHKLVRMNASQLANPDLQEFKEKVDSQSLNQLIIEQPDKPKWIKTHKGEELIENQDEFQPENDAIYARDNIPFHENFEHQEYKDVEKLPIEMNEPIVSSNHQANEDKKNAEFIDVKLSYPEIDNEFEGSVKYLGTSKNIDHNPYMSAMGDGKLYVEGRLSKGKVLSYLHEMLSTRIFLLYELIPKQKDINDQGNNKDESTTTAAANFLKLHEFLITNDKIIGIKNKQRYEKNIYLIPTDEGETSFIINSILNANNTNTTTDNSEKQMFVLIVIKPELIF